MNVSAVNSPASPARHRAPLDWKILCDFDGTISTTDVTDALLSAFGRPGWAALEAGWLRGEIGSRECMAGQIELLDMSRAELDAALLEIEIDPAFVRFVEIARALGMPLSIVSDGLDHVIRSVLAHHAIDGVAVVANRLLQVGERAWRLEFPNAHADCRRASGNCKCALAQQRRQDARVLYIGDGASDFCVAHRVDFVLAKDSLIEYCASNGIEHKPIRDFEEALSTLIQLGSRSRSQMTRVDGGLA
ncbi:MtnX-like HAD-IB family phosphatase [Methylibium sp.]|uniref:MtnX-like HAD-IB family phosphatase n=1 Tax=Methylibium sp. TaxID=2067992 RepID=UPI003D0D1C4F